MRALLIIDPDGVVRHAELHQGTLPDVSKTLAKLAELKG
jgi:alkyl hydroperoxide reductase subunit AhpC